MEFTKQKQRILPANCEEPPTANWTWKQ